MSRWFTGERGPLLALLIYAFGTGFSGALMPGPLLSVTVADAAKNGFWAGPLLMAGHGALELAVIIALAAGLGAALRNWFVFAGVGLVGGAVLLWMGWGMLSPAANADLAFLRAAAEGPQGGSWTPAIAGAQAARGVVTSLSNPYWTLWWATLGMALIARARRHGAAGLATLFVGHISSDVVWYLAVALAVAYGRSFMSPAAYRGLTGVCGIFLIVLAGYFVYSSVREIVRRPLRQADGG